MYDNLFLMASLAFGYPSSLQVIMISLWFSHHTKVLNYL